VYNKDYKGLVVIKVVKKEVRKLIYDSINIIKVVTTNTKRLLAPSTTFIFNPICHDSRKE